MSPSLSLSQNRTLSLIILVGAVAAFAAFSRPTHPEAAAETEPATAPADQSDQAPPSWAFAAPRDADDGAPAADAAADAITGKVLEQIDVAKYSYLRLGVDGRPDVWAAVPVTTSRVGQSVTVSNAEQMTNFASASLKRTFDLIYFGVLDSPVAADPILLPSPTALLPTDDPHQTQLAPHPGPGKEADAVRVTKSEKAPGPLGRTVAELNALGRAEAGSKARVRGTVVKVTSGVLGRTFLHLRDTTGVAPLTHDLAVTTSEDLSLGAEVLLEGSVEIGTDFGSGYRYSVLLADARRVDP